MTVADSNPELANGDDLLVRVVGRFVEIPPHHVNIVSQGPQVVIGFLGYKELVFYLKKEKLNTDPKNCFVHGRKTGKYYRYGTGTVPLKTK